MKKQTVIGIVIGTVVGTAAVVGTALVVRKIVKEIKSDLDQCTFTSPDGNNEVTLSYGASKFAKGLTFIRVKANTVAGKDACKMVLFARNASMPFDCEWNGNDSFTLLVGNGKRKQYCDVRFDGEKVKADYGWRKVALEESDTELFIEEI